jgi:hypothetical protein
MINHDKPVFFDFEVPIGTLFEKAVPMMENLLLKIGWVRSHFQCWESHPR